jgi:hypothetical protein
VAVVEVAALLLLRLVVRVAAVRLEPLLEPMVLPEQQILALEAVVAVRVIPLVPTEVPEL